MVIDTVTNRAIKAAKDRVRANIESNMTSQVIITRSSGMAGVDPDAEGSIESPVAETIYEGPARLANASGSVTYTVGEEVQFYSSGSATVPIDVFGEPILVHVNDILQVLGCDDPVMVGRRFRVVDVEAVGLVPGGRRLQLVGIQFYGGWLDDTVRVPSGGTVPGELPTEWSV